MALVGSSGNNYPNIYYNVTRLTVANVVYVKLCPTSLKPHKSHKKRDLRSFIDQLKLKQHLTFV